MENAADEVETALHPAGVGRDAVLPACREPGELEGHLDPRLEPVAAQAVKLSEELEVLLRGQILVERDRLGGDADLGADRRPGRVGLAVHAHLTRVRSKSADDAVDRGGLSRAVRAEEAEALSWLDLEGNPVHGDQRAVRLLEVPHFDRGHGQPVKVGSWVASVKGDRQSGSAAREPSGAARETEWRHQEIGLLPPFGSA